MTKLNTHRYFKDIQTIMDICEIKWIEDFQKESVQSPGIGSSINIILKIIWKRELVLTICIFETLFFLRRFWDHFDTFWLEDSDVVAVSEEHLERQHKVLPLVRVRNEQRLGSAVVLKENKQTNKLVDEKNKHIKFQ